MQTSVPMPEDECERLAALYGYQLLNTPPEACFDRIAAIAARLCDAPMASVSLVDRDRVHFKSAHGLGISETARKGSFCDVAIARDDATVVEDATADSRFRDNPMVRETPRIRTYAGVPLIDADGFSLGMLSVMFPTVTQVTADQIASLEPLAEMIVELMITRAQAAQARLAEESFQAQMSDFEFTRSLLEEQAARLVGLAEDRDELYRENIKHRQFIELLLQTIPLPIFARDEAQIITHANRAYADFHGMKLDDVLGRHISEIYSPEHVEQTAEDAGALLSEPSGRQSFERTITLQNPERTHQIIVHKAVIRGDDGSPQGTVGTISDVTEMKGMQVELQRLAATDPLTGAANRRAFMDKASTELQRSQRTGVPLAMIMLDIDRFKTINDRYGHRAGDAVLKQLAATCRATIRDSIDLFARIGGEEFVIVAPEIDKAGAAALAERLRQEIAGQELTFEGQVLRYTASFGVAAVDPRSGQDSIDEALKRADACLYRSKARGRNRVTVDSAAALETVA